MSLASTLILRINAPPSFLTKKREKTAQEEAQHVAEEGERWTVIDNAAGRLVVVAGTMLAGDGVRDVSWLSLQMRKLIRTAS